MATKKENFQKPKSFIGSNAKLNSFGNCFLFMTCLYSAATYCSNLKVFFFFPKGHKTLMDHIK